VSAFDDVAGIAPQQIWDGIAARVVHGERITLGVVELDPDIALPEHSHEPEQLGVVLRGSLTFTVGGETRELGPGGTWAIPSGVPHSAVVGSEGAVVIDVFAPTRDDWRALESLAQRPLRWP
jgi:quercetin dioxygenase-like cupin family protein